MPNTIKWIKQCSTMDDSKFIEFIHARLIRYGENPNVDYMERLMQISKEIKRLEELSRAQR